MVLLIRSMTVHDIPEVIAIERDTFSDPWTEEDFRRALIEPGNRYLIARADGRVAGYCGYWGVAGEGHIFNVAVMKEYRGRKIGYRMMMHMIGDAMSRGIASLTLEVRKSNTAAIRLYEKLGFENAGIRKDFYVKPREDAIIMWLRPRQ